MISFYPGPSQVHSKIPGWVKAAHQQGILSMNHRSVEFMNLSEKTISFLKKKLQIPNRYEVYFTGSATECWEIIAQSVVTNKSIHLYNGAFGEKWFDYTKRLKPESEAIVFQPEEVIDSKNIFKDGELICITQNETSNGTQVSSSFLRAIKKNNPNHLMVVDATSSMAGVMLDFKAADIWFASVQKCFGLPAGMAILVCSPKAIDRIKSINENKHYNSLTLMNEMMTRWQTPFTPNVLGIYLLMRSLENSKSIKITEQKITKRFHAWKKFFSHAKTLQLLIKNKNVRSKTVLVIEGAPEQIQKIKASTKKKGIVLGEGYGKLKATTFRIANFPAIKLKHIDKLMELLKGY